MVFQGDQLMKVNLWEDHNMKKNLEEWLLLRDKSFRIQDKEIY
jgi:hypothetical protein